MGFESPGFSHGENVKTSDTKAFYIPIDNDDFEEGGIPKPSKVLVSKPYILEKSLYI